MLAKTEIESMLSRSSISDADFVRLGPGAVPVLIDVFHNDRSERRDGRRRMALHALGLLGGDQAVDFLIATAEDPEEEAWLRSAAVRSLGYANHPKSLDFLKATLRHPEYDFRKSAVLALTHSTDPEALAVLETVKESGEPRLAEKLSRIAEEQQGRFETADAGEPPKV